ncbi:MAG: divergent PAP2 family protein [Carboxydocellales bacterium]
MHSFWSEIFLNRALWAAGIAVLVAQIIKVFWVLLVERRLWLRMFTEAGGMPSSHSAMVSALATSTGIQAGWNSPLFAVAAIFAAVVMYDAAGVRRAAGMQAEVLNKIIDDLYQGRPIRFERLKELLGHSPVEVLAGALLGISLAAWF